MRLAHRSCYVLGEHSQFPCCSESSPFFAGRRVILVSRCSQVRISATQSPMATGGESAHISAVDDQGHTNGHLEVLARLGYLPLLHILVEERAGERRFTTFRAAGHGFPSPFPSRRQCGARGRKSHACQGFFKN